MEGLFAAIAMIGSMILLIGGFKWIMAKFFGTRFHGRFQAQQAFNEQQQDEIHFKMLYESKPMLVDKAINRCKSKNYKMTHSNIIAEVYKIEKEESGELTKKEQVFSKLKSLTALIKPYKSGSKIEKLEKISLLYKEGRLNQSEFDALKKEIFK